MPYSKSNSRNEFETITSNLLKSAKKVSKRQFDSLSHVRDLVYQAAIFQTSAQFEEYIKSIIESWVFQLKQNGKKVDCLPMIMRSYLFSSSQIHLYKAYMASGDEKKLVSSINFSHDSFSLISPSIELPRVVNSKSVLNEKKYPSKDNMKTLFFRIGIDNIFDKINAHGKRDYITILDSFMSVRTSIAHSSPQQLTFEDVERNLQSVVSMIRSLDRVLYSHFVRYGGKSCWK